MRAMTHRGYVTNDTSTEGDVAAHAHAPHGASGWTAEKALWGHVLTEALKKYHQCQQEESPLARDARRELELWLESDSEERGAFVFICDFLDLEPTAVRRAFYKLKGG